MSHITQCPKCSTHFRVVADQLKISDGWVRCGQCGEVFDAKVSLKPWPLQPAPAQPAKAQLQRPSVVESPSAAAPEPQTQQPMAAPEVLEDGLAEPTFAKTERSKPEPKPEPEPEPEPGVLASVSEPLTVSHDVIAEAPPQNLTFLRTAKRRAAWRKPWVLALGWLIGFALAVVLAGQVLLHERHRLAAAYPELLPELQTACQFLGCNVNLYRHLESVQIESSALVKERKGIYRLEVVLKNTSGWVLAMPALELGLTDPAEAVVVRRVILPSEWEPSSEALAPNATFALSVRLSLSEAPALRMAGYRVLVFYP